MHDANNQTRIDMLTARRGTTFDIEIVRNFLHNGEPAWRKRQQVVQTLAQDPIFDKSQRDFMTRTERYQRGLSMTNRIFELQEIHKWSRQDVNIALASLDEAFPISLHNMAFKPVILSQGSSALVTKYSALIATKGILGCYLQTELGHGTNVSQLETLATYIPETQEFEIHSPTLTSSKWWIGALGKTSTHGVVQAKLILGGKDMGPHLFFVQLRDMNSHEVLPGITLGDIGLSKALAGFSPTDNGFARFDHVRIPKFQMLSKFAQVTDNGQYVQPPHAKLSYGGMLYIRASMVSGAGWTIARGATISIRYATVRRQGEKGADGLERQTISYPSLYYRLLPILSHAYVFIQLGKSLIKAFDVMASKLAVGDTSLLAEMHATTSGLKVLVSTTGVHDLEVARRSMGGHGYSAFAGLGRIYADYLPSTTYEGDNFVLDQQVARAALKSYKIFTSSKTPTSSSLTPSSNYLRCLLEPHLRLPSSETISWTDPATCIQILEWRAALVVREHAQNISDPDASVYQRVSKAVTEAFVAAQVGGMLKDLPSHEPEARVLRSVYLLYLLTSVESGLVDLLSFGVFQPQTNVHDSRDLTRSLRVAIRETCQVLLPNAIGLSDAFGYTDWELDSALGVYDGKVYEALWARAQTEPLNEAGVTPAYKESIRPILTRGQRQAGGAYAKL
ncbi:acyl-CoA oxidase [Infundibulicybe gibba]|nr:acyl-CoA oxidase [Infundibulicybe gibba]